MTQPVQEPNVQRNLSGLGWGERQLARRPAPAVSVGQPGVGFAASISLPVLELAYQSNNIESSGAPTWAIDNTYAFNGYMQMTAQNAWVAWPIVLAPKGSVWMPYAVLGQGPDYGIVSISIASAPIVDAGDDTDGLGGAGLFQDPGSATFVNWPSGGSWDGYLAGETPYGGSSQIWNGFRIMGDDGVIGTSLGVATNFAAHGWDGGSGPHYLKLTCSTKNGSSSGYKWRLSALGFIRMDWFNLF